MNPSPFRITSNITVGKNRINIQDAKTVLWTLLTVIYEDELIEEPQRRETIIENIERQKEQLLVNILGPR
jgi:uncharacterized DUF497 family protein